MNEELICLLYLGTAILFVAGLLAYKSLALKQGLSDGQIFAILLLGALWPLSTVVAIQEASKNGSLGFLRRPAAPKKDPRPRSVQ